ncbi:hypothetical protein [Streptomyces diastaticus]|uniref:hypothetical protein n=1 Tax=Streptomyces diastaticus TaxID=1956 RepID=UPI00381EC24F
MTDRRLRWALRSGSAAATGHLLIWGVTGDPMAGAALMERLTASVPQLASAGLTAACLYGGWHGVKRIRLHKLPGIFGLAARPAGSLIAALWAQGTAPVVADLMAMTAPWSTLLAPLLAAGPVAAGCWYVLDRRAARARLIPPARWAAHIPLATTCLSALLYAPGAAL